MTVEPASSSERRTASSVVPLRGAGHVHRRVSSHQCHDTHSTSTSAVSTKRLARRSARKPVRSVPGRFAMMVGRSTAVAGMVMNEYARTGQVPRQAQAGDAARPSEGAP